MVETIISKGDLNGSESQQKPPYSHIPCLQCGICCEGYLVRLSLIEARCIADGLGIEWRHFQNKFVTECWPGANSFYLNQRDGVCVFLKPSGVHGTVCLVHSFKPSACREWTPSLSRRQCRAGLNRYWGLTVDSTGELRGSEDKLQDFRSFWESRDGE